MKIRHMLSILILTAPSWAPIAFDCGADAKAQVLAQQPVQSDSLSTSAAASRYVAGTYQSADGKRRYRVSGPAQTADHGRQKWSISADDGDFSATWITGSPEGHPVLKGEGVPKDLSSAYDYGRVGVSSGIGVYIGWIAGRLIGVSQVGEDIAISYFGYDYLRDSPVEKGSFSLRLSKPGNPGH